MTHTVAPNRRKIDRARTSNVAALPPRHHLDSCALVNGWLFVVGWCAYSPLSEPEFALSSDGVRHPPLATISRQDVLEYLISTVTPGVDRFDIARSFAFAVPASDVCTCLLHLPGGSAPVVLSRLPAGTGHSVLVRYLDALANASCSPAADLLVGFLERQLAGLLTPGVNSETDSLSLAMLRDASETFGGLFALRPSKLGARVAIFAIHQTARMLSASQTAMIRALTAARTDVVLVNSAPESQAGLAEANSGTIAGLIRRGNHGRDFASWLIALDRIDGSVRDAEHVILCNDSFFGPFGPLDRLLDQAARPEIDVWALTDSWERGYHLQSSFMVISARALAGRAIARFRARYDFPDQKDAVIEKGEIGLSRALIEDGEMRLDVLAPYHELARAYLACADATLAAARAAIGWWPEGEPIGLLTWLGQLLDDIRSGAPRNPQHVFWEQLLADRQIPFVKRELVQLNPALVPDLHRIAGRVADLYGTHAATELTRDMRLGSRRAPAWQASD